MFKLLLNSLLFIHLAVGWPMSTQKRTEDEDAPVPVSDHVLTLSRRSSNNDIVRRETLPITELRNQEQYMAPVQIDGSTFNLVVDTGSSQTWVMNANGTCHSDNCTFHKRLDVPATEEMWAPFSQGYLDGTGAFGGLIFRNLSIAGIPVENQLIGAADNVTDVHQLSQYDGLLGLGPKNGTKRIVNGRLVGPYPTVFDNMKTQSRLKRNSFSLTLYGTSDITGEVDKGVLAFGGYPADLTVTSNWGMAPISVNDGRYIISVDTYRFPGGEKITLNKGENEVLVDSGTFLTLLPQSIADAMFNLLPGEPGDGGPDHVCTTPIGKDEKCKLRNGTWRVPCRSNDQLPSFEVRVGGVLLPIKPENLVVYDQELDYCFAGFFRRAPGFPVILGETFMKSVITLFDFQDTPVLKMATWQKK